MKHINRPRRPTYDEKRLIEARGRFPGDWLVVTADPDKLILLFKHTERRSFAWIRRTA